MQTNKPERETNTRDPKALLRPHPLRRLTVVDFPAFLYVRRVILFLAFFLVFVSLLGFASASSWAARGSQSLSIIAITLSRPSGATSDLMASWQITNDPRGSTALWGSEAV